MKSLINGLSAEFDILYNDHLELITVKNYQQELISNIRKGKNILLEQRTRKNYQMLIAASEEG
jgi:aspartate kinase